MRKEIFKFPGAGEKPLSAVILLPEGAPIGVLQVTHGMTEHMGRWENFAAAITEVGYAVCGFDLRGHGADVVCPGIASFGQADWEATLEDMHCLFLRMQERFSELPYHMLGFSLGSFLLREYMGRYPDGVSGMILVGTGQQPGFLLNILQAAVRSQIKKAGWEQTTPLVRKLSFETYNKRFAPNRTAADWLCADETELDAYLKDPQCKEDISAGLFYHLLGGMKRCGAADACKHYPKALPVLLLSGADDPVGEMGKGVMAVEKQFGTAGMTRVQTMLLPGARHDLLHEEKSGAAEQATACICQFLTEKDR